MNTEQFYQLFKESLNTIGVGWSHKDQSTVHIEDDFFVMRSMVWGEVMEVWFKLPKKS